MKLTPIPRPHFQGIAVIESPSPAKEGICGDGMVTIEPGQTRLEIRLTGSTEKMALAPNEIRIEMRGTDQAMHCLQLASPLVEEVTTRFDKALAARNEQALSQLGKDLPEIVRDLFNLPANNINGHLQLVRGMKIIPKKHNQILEAEDAIREYTGLVPNILSLLEQYIGNPAQYSAIPHYELKHLGLNGRIAGFSIVGPRSYT